MLALKITDQKDFTNKLFLGDTFDLFWLNQAEITTSNLFTIDGRLQTEFFDNDQQEFLSSSHRTYSLWKEVKPICYSIIRGKRAPLSFKIVLQFSPNKACPASELVPSFSPGTGGGTISEPSVQKQNPSLHYRHFPEDLFPGQRTGPSLGAVCNGVFQS